MSLNLIQTAIKTDKVVIFSKSFCPYCKKVKEIFNGIGQSFRLFELDQMENGSDVQASLVDMTGQRTVPNVFINGKHIGGCDSVQKLADAGKLKSLL